MANTKALIATLTREQIACLKEELREEILQEIGEGLRLGMQLPAHRRLSLYLNDKLPKQEEIISGIKHIVRAVLNNNSVTSLEDEQFEAAIEIANTVIDVLYKYGLTEEECVKRVNKPVRRPKLYNHYLRDMQRR